MSKKLVLFDPYGGKFTTDMQEWLVAHDYEVKYERYYNPTLVPWADIIYFYTCDNNLKVAMNPGEAILADWLKDGVHPVDMHDMNLTGKKIIVEPVDIEVWNGCHADAKLWDLVDDVVFLAPHIQKLMMSDSRPQQGHFKQHVIPCGVDLNKWTFREHTAGKKIAIVSEKWIIKGMQNILQIAYELPRDYEFHWAGIWSNDYPYFRDYCEDFIERNKLNFTFYDWVENLDEWLDDKDYLLHAGMKEAFCFAVAEAMAKGIKPILHHFYGAEALWDGMTWQSPSEAVKRITEHGNYFSHGYRQYLIDEGYTIEKRMKAIDDIITA